MPRESFHTPNDVAVRAVTAPEMRAVDRIAVETVGLQLLQMMENAGRILAWHARRVREGDGLVTVVAGNGGNGGGGMACARHLANRDVPVEVILDRETAALSGAQATQYRILEAMELPVESVDGSGLQFEPDGVVVDALVGYGLQGAVRSPANQIITTMNDHPATTISLDVPSGVDATTGETGTVAVQADRTITLALPKTGLGPKSGQIFLADIGIPRTVYDRLGLEYVNPFGETDWIELH